MSNFLCNQQHEKQSLLTRGARVGFPLIMTLVAICQAAAQSENFSGGRREALTPLVFQAAGPDEAFGPDAAAIQSMVDAFRAKLGEPNNANDPGPLAAGRREINWDGGGNVDATTPPVTPFEVFLNTRGARFTTLGIGLSQAPPAGGPQGGLAGLFNNPTYGGNIFTVFRALRLFTPVGSNDRVLTVEGSSAVGTPPLHDHDDFPGGLRNTDLSRGLRGT